MKILEKKCISVIAQEFERFHIAILASNDEVLKKNLEFLQRKYSYQVGSELFRTDKLQDEYLDFFINEHLKILHFEWLENSSHLTSAKNIFSHLPLLTKITGRECTDEILKNIAKFCPKIVEIDASFSYVTNTGVKYLCKNENVKGPCPKLKNLFIRGSKVTGKGVKYLLQNLPSLEIIDYENLAQKLYSLHKGDLPKLKNVPSYNLICLNELDFLSDLPYYTNFLKVCLTVCPKLKSISCVITKKQQLAFFKNSTLEDLKLNFSILDPQYNVDSFLRYIGSNLVRLKIENCTMSIPDLAVSCPKLRYLCMKNIIISNKENDNVQPIFRYLKECDLWSIDERSSMKKAMSFLLLSVPNLQVIRFKWCDLSPDTKACILKCCDNHLFKKISFRSVLIEVNFVKDILSRCPSLELITIVGYAYDYVEKEELYQFAEKLPNRPFIECIDI